ncbi:MAG TPA: DivIVA domain-containing protein, partial [Euzebya sp.]|nr:DivIVA domain-containing protein [Euzebya sp.]
MLTPEEIQSREFLVSLRGYDRDEVHAFLDEVAVAFTQLRAEAGDSPPVGDAPAVQDRADATADGDDAEPAVSPFAAIAAETQRILEAAQAAGEEMRKRAQREAESDRQELLSSAEDEVVGLREQIVAAQHDIDMLRLRREEIGDQLRQARETAELALMQLEDPVVEDPVVEDTVVEDAV